MVKNNKELVTYVKSKLNIPTIYMLSGFGRPLTKAQIDRRVATGCAHTKANYKKLNANLSKYCFDCVGLIKGAIWEESPGKVAYNVPKGSDQNVGMMYRSATEKGPISSMPDIPGLLVFTADLGHVGVYIGKDANGKRQYVESTPAWNKWGVCQSNDSIRKWGFWGKYHLIEYVVPKPKPVVVKPKPSIVPPVKVDRVLRVGDQVQIVREGNVNSFGTGRTSHGIGFKRHITKIWPGRKFPYQVGYKGRTGARSTTGFYDASALKKL